MSKMRLTTLNLDEDCLKVLGTAKNKSRYARECILRYNEVTEELDRIEDLYSKYVAAIRHLAGFLAEHELQSLLGEYMDETELAISQMKNAGYLQEAVVAEALRHVKP